GMKVAWGQNARATSVRVEHAVGVSLGYRSDRNLLHDRHRSVVHYHRGIFSRDGYIQVLAVGRDGEPLGVEPDFHHLQQFVVRNGVSRDVVVILAGDPQHFSVGRDGQTMRRRALQALRLLLLPWRIWKGDPPDLPA